MHGFLALIIAVNDDEVMKNSVILAKKQFEIRFSLSMIESYSSSVSFPCKGVSLSD